MRMSARLALSIAKVAHRRPGARTSVIAPIVYRRGDAGLPLRPSEHAEGMERREAPHQLHLAVPRPLRRTLRPAALHRGVLRRPGRAFGGFSRFAFGPQARPLSEHRTLRASGAQAARAVSQLLAGGPSAPGRSPGAARARGDAFSPLPAGTAPCSVVETPREDALSRTR
jgi:hypothetical protein